MLKENTLAPDFTLNDQEGRTHSLSDYKGNWLLMYFYPMDFTPGCTTEACSIRNAFSDFDKYHIKVLGVNNGTEVSHKKFAEKFKLTFPLLSDTKMGEVILLDDEVLLLRTEDSKRTPQWLVIPKDGEISEKEWQIIEDVFNFRRRVPVMESYAIPRSSTNLKGSGTVVKTLRDKVPNPKKSEQKKIFNSA